MALPFPETALRDHIASLGKTGSGKTSDTKVIVEHITTPGWQNLPQGARVCILDTIKSDWWGLTSSMDGKKPGRPFQILGGPKGHVPLYSRSGKVIGELVATGALQLSILDMADFEPGGLQRFFADFAQALFKKIRGVLYLVVEEAHEFAPKERSGMGNENLSIHWMKKLATAGRTKGIRLIVCTQRTQALHNAVLGSCETMIAGRFTAPADQEPVLGWFKANVSKDKLKEIATSMSKLKNGEAWVACGEADFLQRVQFPRITTYDNSATPEHGTADVKISTAPVDREKLAQLIGLAEQEITANDPRALQAEVKRLTAELAKASRQTSQPVEKINTEAIEAEITKARTQLQERATAFQAAVADAEHAVMAMLPEIRQAVTNAESVITDHLRNLKKALPAATVENLAKYSKPISLATLRTPVCKPAENYAKPMQAPLAAGSDDGLTAPQRRIMASLAFWRSIGHETPTREQVAAVAGYRPGSGNFNNLIGSLSSGGYTSVPSTGCLTLVADYPGLTPDEAKEKLWSIFENPQRRLVESALAAPADLSRDKLATNSGYSPGSGNFNNICGSLTSMDVLQRTGQGRVGISDWAREVLA